ncbi:MAG TPA: hypothetical protein VF518_16960, partial [Polyangia bacterium]
MTKAPPQRLSHLAAHEDPHGLAPLFQSAKLTPDEALPRLCWRLRSTLRYQAARPRRLLRVALTSGVVFVTGAAVGAVLLSRWERNLSVTAAEVEPRPRSSFPPVRAKRHAATAETPLAASPVLSIDPPPVENGAVVTASHRAPSRPANQPAIPPAPAPAASAPVQVPAPPSAIAIEQALLGDILKALRQQHDPQAALDLLE